jgi:cytochrome b561
MQLHDTKTGYGWVSIALHWIAAIIIIAMWFIGSTSADAIGAERLRLISIHTTVALLGYPLLVGRIGWRVLKGHPGPLPGQKGRFHALGRFFHYGMIGSIGMMLVSGPVMAWSGAIPIRLFDLELPALLGPDVGVFSLTHSAHRFFGGAIILATLFHIGAVFKHMAIDRDRTMEKMLIPTGVEGSSIDRPA